MPPKPKSPTKGKKGKLSKAEKERLKKEELERKAKEEEDARLKAEQEERERLERERLEREERERIEAAESQRYTTEINELRSVLEGNKNALANLLEQEREKKKWSRFMRCDGSPDPTVPAEINTYINLWKEDDSRNSLSAVLSESNLTLGLIEELQQYVEDHDDTEFTDDHLAEHEGTIVELENLLSCKLDAATLELLKGATFKADSESGNLQLVEGNENLVMMVWGNLTKNPRFKTFAFEESKLSFELPKQLALSDIAVRFIQSKYDHYSHRCRTYRLKKKRKKVVVEETPEVVEEEKKDETEGEVAKEEDEDGSREAGDDEVKEENAPEEENKDETVTDEDTESPETDDKVPKSDETKEEVGEEGEIDGQDEEEDEDEMNEFEDEDTVDLRAYQVLGGVLYFDLLTLPPQPKQVKGWIMTQVTSSELQRVPYPPVDATKLSQTLSGTITMGQTLDPKALANAAAATEALGAPPVGVKFKLPDNVLYSEEPQLVYWSEKGSHWRLDGFTDITYNEDEKNISFKTINFGPLACIQDKHINMPFQSWELRPLGSNHTKLTVVSAILEVEIEIKDALCCFHLTAESDPKPGLDSIMNKWMTPPNLIKAMRSAGVNLFPERDSHKYVSITEKDENVEAAVYEQMSLTASNFAYSWSKWNCEASQEKIVILGAEKLDGNALTDEEWSMLLMRNERCFKLKMKEFDEEFSEVYADGIQFHADLYHMVIELSSDAGRERMGQTDFKFVNAVNQILSASKVITYS